MWVVKILGLGTIMWLWHSQQPLLAIWGHDGGRSRHTERAAGHLQSPLSASPSLGGLLPSPSPWMSFSSSLHTTQQHERGIPEEGSSPLHWEGWGEGPRCRGFWGEHDEGRPVTLNPPTVTVGCLCPSGCQNCKDMLSDAASHSCTLTRGGGGRALPLKNISPAILFAVYLNRDSRVWTKSNSIWLKKKLVSIGNEKLLFYIHSSIFPSII